MLDFPRRIPRRSLPKRRAGKCQGHLSWVRKHFCCVPGCGRSPIETAHVRKGTNGGIATKTSDRWVISLCAFHHREQHATGERRFEDKYEINLKSLACAYARRLTYWHRIMEVS